MLRARALSSRAVFSRRPFANMALPPGAIHELVGEAASAEELQACRIGGKCGKDTPLLPPEAVHARMAALPRWQLSPDSRVLSREFVARHWQASIDFFNSVHNLQEALRSDEIS